MIFNKFNNLETSKFYYSSAGVQTKPLVRMGNGEKKKLYTDGLLISNTIPLEILRFEEQTLALTPGTTIFITTDGLPEQDNGEEWFINYYKDIFYENSHLTPDAIVPVINLEFYLFNNNSPVGDDDITYLILQVNPGNTGEGSICS